MATRRQTIEINGQIYDAVSGELIKASAKSPMPMRVMDGFMKHRPASVVDPLPASTPAAKKQRVSIQTSKPAPRPVKRSTTLMRHVVKKPLPTTTHLAKAEVKKPTAMPAHRLHRAGTTPKSELISKFGRAAKAPINTQIASVPVQAPPVTAPLADLRHQIAAVTATPFKGAKSVFEQAMHQSDSHAQPKIKKTKLNHRVAKKFHLKPHSFNLMTSLLVGALLGGFFFYNNVPGLSMRVAAARAGVDASLPGYKPAGFSMNRRINYKAGQISVKFKSNSDDRAFELKQKKTALNPQDLAEKLDKTAQGTVQTYQDEDKTIYIYKGSNAAWVENGVVCQVEGESSLSTDQLVRLATSI